ncbi:hypothetical protein E4T48_02176 [Aureobasidium sp. EXF-10727]|nr:hypothetical protein E4T48_02176 [Aureobasidium sp. EXF-10727]
MSEIEKQPLIEDQPKATLQDLRERWTEARANLQTAAQELLTARREYERAWSRTTRGRITIAAFCIFIITIFLLPLGGLVLLGLMDDEPEAYEYLPRRVPLEAHIMSKCPDARDCLHDLVLPAMVNVSNLVDFKLSYIGKTIEDDDGVICMHGPSECLGNSIELCAAHLYPNPRIHLGFTMCMSRNYSEIPSEDLAKDCALEHGIDFEKLNHCLSVDDGAYSRGLLKKSVQRSADKGVTKSCTIRVDDKNWCIRDGGKWTDCENGHEVKDLIGEIYDLRWKHSSAYEAKIGSN